MVLSSRQGTGLVCLGCTVKYRDMLSSVWEDNLGLGGSGPYNWQLGQFCDHFT